MIKPLKYLIRITLLLFLIAPLFAQDGSNAGELELNIILQETNRQTPHFEWSSQRGAYYELYIDGQKVYEGSAPSFPNADHTSYAPLSYGSHDAYVVMRLRRERLRSATVDFRIEQPEQVDSRYDPLRTSSSRNRRTETEEEPVQEEDAISMAAARANPEILEISFRPNPDDIKRPFFNWQAVQGAEYHLYISNELFYSGMISEFPPTPEYPYEEFAYGYYQMYIMVMKEGDYVRGPTSEFHVGLAKPELVYPPEKGVIYNPIISFQWSDVTNADNYELFLDGDSLYTGTDTSFVYKAQPGDFTRHDWFVVARNDFQTIRSEKGLFKLNSIPSPELISPPNEFSVVLESEEDIPTLKWKPIAEQSDNLFYVVYINDEEDPVWRGLETEYTPKDLEIGIYSWQVRCVYHDGKRVLQKSEKSERRIFTLRDRAGLYVGVRVGAGVSFTSNTEAEPRFAPALGGYIEKRFGKSTNAFQIRLELGLSLEKRNLFFDLETYPDNTDIWSQSFVYSTTYIGIPLILKFFIHKLDDTPLDLYPFFGPVFGIRINHRMQGTDTGSSYKIDDTRFPIKRGDVGLTLGIGLNFTTPIDFIAEQKLQFQFLISFQPTISNPIPKLDDDFFRGARHISRFMLYGGIKLVDF